MLLLPLFSLLLGVQGHGNMVWPPTWFDSYGLTGLTPGHQCQADGGTEVGACMWYTNYTFTDGMVTLPDEMRTYQDWCPGCFDPHPWRAPGAAPVYSPWGVMGGNPLGCPIGDPASHSCPGGGFSNGLSAESMMAAGMFPGVITTQWTRGRAEQVGWGIIANHGGGYSYRLCKEGEDVTEECFQKTVLDFVGDVQWVQYGEGGEQVEFPAKRTRVGTSPPGSHWTRNPIPACIEPDGGYFNDEDDCPNGTQFPPPAPGLQGYGETHVKPGEATFLWTLMDLVLVPAHLEPGNYILSFRWDCEQTSQIWNACSSISVV